MCKSKMLQDTKEIGNNSCCLEKLKGAPQTLVGVTILSAGLVQEESCGHLYGISPSLKCVHIDCKLFYLCQMSGCFSKALLVPLVDVLQNLHSFTLDIIVSRCLTLFSGHKRSTSGNLTSKCL